VDVDMVDDVVFERGLVTVSIRSSPLILEHGMYLLLENKFVVRIGCSDFGKITEGGYFFCIATELF